VTEGAFREGKIRLEVDCQRRHHGLSASQYNALVTDNDGEYVCDHSAFWVAKRSKTSFAGIRILKVCGGLPLEKVDCISAG
jgi:hypothetical protein